MTGVGVLVDGGWWGRVDGWTLASVCSIRSLCSGSSAQIRNRFSQTSRGNIGFTSPSISPQRHRRTLGAFFKMSCASSITLDALSVILL